MENFSKSLRRQFGQKYDAKKVGNRYGMAINNYWIYHDPATGRAVFLPHGMDQLFYEPQAGLLPDLKGVLAAAVLQTQTGRREFRARCVPLFTNLFPTLSNRVEKARARIHPVLAEVGSKAASQHDAAVTNLQRRIQQRLEHLRRELFAAPYAPLFNEHGIATLTNWLATMEGRNMVLSETNSGGEQRLQVQLESGGSQGVARWQTLVMLPAGTYQLSARVTADQPVFRGPSVPVSLRVWGMTEVQLETVRKDPRTLEIQCGFEAAGVNQGEFLIQCEAHGAESLGLLPIRFD